MPGLEDLVFQTHDFFVHFLQCLALRKPYGLLPTGLPLEAKLAVLALEGSVELPK